MTDISKPSNENLPSLEDVRAYLSAHPEFFAENQDLLANMNPPVRVLGDGVVDLQRTMNDRLRSDLKQVRTLQAAFVANSEANLNLIERYHAAAFAVVDADSLRELTHVIEHEVADLLELDAASLLVEAADVPASWLDEGLRAVAPGRSALWMGAEEILLRPAPTDRVEIHGPKASMVQSDALIRLPMPEGYPRIMLAMGINVPEHFHADQGTEFIAFFSAVVARSLLRWAIY